MNHKKQQQSQNQSQNQGHKKPNSKNQRNNKSRRDRGNQNQKNVVWTDALSENFTKKDFVCKTSGQFKISLGLVGALELLQAKIGIPLKIIKGFESVEVAEKRSDFKRNFHTQGLAADVQVSEISPQDLFIAAESIDEIKGIGLNLDENYVHIDTRKDKERSLWIETKNNKIDIDQTNRSKYFDGIKQTQ
jgi:uncharacterized protein YcbK (DUF882 family)